MQRIIFFLLLFMMTAAGPAFAQGTLAGSVKNVRGDVSIRHQGSILPLEKEMQVYTEDYIKTGRNGSVGIRLQDNTTFSLGPDTELVIEKFVFAPDESRFALLANMIKGTFVYISGIIGKLSPESIQLQTPVGTIAVRGTRFAAKFAGN